jgi:hypothetical protein
MGLLVDRFELILDIVLDERKPAGEYASGLALADRDAKILHLAGGWPGGRRKKQLISLRVMQDDGTCLRPGQFLTDGEDVYEHLVERQGRGQPVDGVKQGL